MNKMFYVLSTVFLVFQLVLPSTSFAATNAIGKEKVDVIHKQLDTGLKMPSRSSKPIELTKQRKANQRTFLNPNGSFTTEMYQEPIFWKNKSGNWELIQNNLKDSTQESDTAFENTSNAFDVKFKKNVKQNHTLSFSVNDKKVYISPVQPNESKIVQQNNEITYQNAYTQTDLNYSVTNVGVKENIVLKDSTAPNSFQFEIDSNSVTPTLKNGVLSFTSDDKKVDFQTSPYIAYDNKDDSTTDIQTTLDKQSNGTYLLTVTLNKNWLDNPKRAFPVTIDPTITYQYPNTRMGDAFVYEGDPNGAYGSSYYVRSGSNIYGRARIYASFRLPEIPAGAKVSNATLQWTPYNNINPTDHMQVYQVNSSWSTSSITWNNQPPVALTASSETSGGSTPQGFDVTSLVNSWYNGTTANYGLMIRNTDESTAEHDYYSTDNSDSTKNPVLSVTYTVDSPGNEPYWTYDNDINLSNGNLFLTSLDASLDGRGLPIEVGRYYNSNLKDTDSELGKGWSFSLNDRLIYKDPSVSFSVLYQGADGVKNYFSLISGKWEAMNLPLDLVYDSASSTFSLVEKSGDKYLFDSSGYLIGYTDTNNNTTTYTRDANHKVTKISDPSLRVINITYSANGLITKVSGNEITTVNFIYDASNRLTEVDKVDSTNAILSKERYDYNDQNQLIAEYDSADNKTNISYDSQNRATSYEQDDSSTGTLKQLTTSYTYGNNLTVTKTDARGVKTLYTFNDSGNLTKLDENYNDSTQTSSKTTSWVWNQNNTIAKVTDPRGNATSYSYDNNQNVTAVADPKGYQELLKYDTKSNLTQATGFVGQTLKNYYDTGNNKTDKVDPSASTVMTDYDSHGNPISDTRAISLANNLVYNSGFEDWTSTLPTSWVATTGQTGTIAKTTSTVKNGYNAMLLSSTTSTQTASITSDFIPVAPNKNYSFAFQANTWQYSSSGKLSGAIRWFASDYSTQIGSDVPIDSLSGTTNGWFRHTKSFTSPDGAAYARIVFNSNLMDSYIDNIQLEDGDYINSISYVANSDLETDNNQDGQPDNFKATNTTTGDGLDTSTQKSGTHSLLIKGNGTSKTYVQTINYPGKKGTSITLSGNAKTQGITPSSGSVNIQASVVYSDGSNDFYVLDFGNSNADWGNKELTFTAKKDYDHIDLIYQNANQTGQSWFDDGNVRINSIQSAMVSDYNLAPNPSFENVSNGSVTDWSLWSDSTLPYYDVLQNSNAFVGIRAFRIITNGNYVALRTNLTEPRKSGMDYSATIVAKTENVTVPGAVLKIRGYDANGNVVGDKSSKVMNANADWKRYIVTFNRNDFPTATSLKAFVEIPKGVNGTYWFDAIRFQENNLISTTQYDSNGNYVTSEADEEGNTTNYTVDNRGQVTNIQFPNPNTFSHFTYDGLGRKTDSYDSSNLETKTVYDSSGNIQAIQYLDHLTGNTFSSYQYQYNRFGELIQKTNPLNQTEKISYDELGQITDITKPDGHTIHTQYDNLGNVNNVSNNADSSTLDFTYDKNGNVLTVKKNGTDTKTFNYDPQLNEATSINFPTYASKQQTMYYGYNPNGTITNYRLSTLNTPVLYQYNTSGIPISVTGTSNQISNSLFDESSRLLKTESTIGTSTFKTDYTYNNTGKAVGVSLEGADGTMIDSEKLAYDNQGNITSDTHSDNSHQNYTYDNANRLTKEVYYNASGTATKTISYTYDDFGNRTKKTEDGVDTSYQYDVANRLTSINSTPISFDSNGNLTNDGTDTYTYNVNNQLTDIKDTNNNSVGHYEYDETGKRIKKVSGNKTEYYYYIGNNLAYITDNNNNIKYEFTRDATGQLFSFTDYTSTSHPVYYYRLNQHGDVIGLYNASGQSVVSYSYDSFGNILSSTGNQTLGNGYLLKDENPFRYASYFYDTESHLYYLLARYYEAKSGRFLTEDAVDSNNLYRYGENNPINFVDPTGMFVEGSDGERAIYTPYSPNHEYIITQGPRFSEGSQSPPSHSVRKSLVGIGVSTGESVSTELINHHVVKKAAKSLANSAKAISKGASKALKTIAEVPLVGTGVGILGDYLVDKQNFNLGRSAANNAILGATGVVATITVGLFTTVSLAGAIGIGVAAYLGWEGVKYVTHKKDYLAVFGG